MTFEITCESIDELDAFAKQFGKTIEHFIVTEIEPQYRYSYIELFGPEGICKIEINYSSNVD